MWIFFTTMVAHHLCLCFLSNPLLKFHCCILSCDLTEDTSSSWSCAALTALAKHFPNGLKSDLDFWPPDPNWVLSLYPDCINQCLWEDWVYVIIWNKMCLWNTALVATKSNSGKIFKSYILTRPTPRGMKRQWRLWAILRWTYSQSRTDHVTWDTAGMSLWIYRHSLWKIQFFNNPLSTYQDPSSSNSSSFAMSIYSYTYFQ